MKNVLTLTFVLRDGMVLLGHKQRGFGAGLWNGYGGKVEQGETIEVAAERELFEESGLTAENLTPVGEITFTYRDTGEVMRVHLFIAHAHGEPIATEEMHPQWFCYDQIPYDAMWSDDPYWLPRVLSGEVVHGTFTFSAPERAGARATILQAEVATVGAWR